MSASPLLALPPWLQSAFAARGFSELTPVQAAVLDPKLSGRDLRIGSATGSGKTAALAMVLAESLPLGNTMNAGNDKQSPVGPSVLVVAPTRELAAQLRHEFSQLYASLGIQVALVLGGGAYREELRALRRGPAVLVATPGRLVDHMNRGAVSLANVQGVALDEADQLLELGFKDELEAILAACPKERRTLLVSATFNEPVRRLADKHQRKAITVQGTPLGQPHADIEHVMHVIHGRDQLAAITNLLLAAGDDRALVFMTTRLQVTEYVEKLSQRGFSVSGLSGEMSQAERSRALSAFRRGATRVLVATDVAARGIDVQDVKLVIHAFPPRDAEALIHRSGRTGRAGQQGRSVQLVTPMDTRRIERLFSSAGLRAKMQPVPGPKDVYLEHDRRLLELLVGMEHQEAGSQKKLAERLLKKLPPAELVSRLLSQIQLQLPCEPESLAPVFPKAPAKPQKKPFGRPRAPLHSKKGDSAQAKPGKRPPPRRRKPAKPGRSASAHAQP